MGSGYPLRFETLARRHGIGKSVSGDGPKAVLQESGGGAGRFGVALSTGNSAFYVAVVLAACLAQPAFALDPRYPDWPCQQLKVPGISVASVWTGPSIEGIDKVEPADPRQPEIVARLAARCTPMEDARKLIAEY